MSYTRLIDINTFTGGIRGTVVARWTVDQQANG